MTPPSPLRPLDLFKALSDPNRLLSIQLIYRHQELCVCELVEALDCPQPKISRNLALLRKMTVLTDRRQGQWVFYRLNTGLPHWALFIIEQSMLAHSDTLRDALKRLSQMSDRPIRCCA